MKKEDVDIASFLEDRSITYYTEGKNISSGWIGIQCPFCNDHSNHCGINIATNIFSCWICGEKGNVFKLISELEQCSYKKAKTIASQFRKDISCSCNTTLLLNNRIEHSVQDVLPKTCQNTLPKIHTNYLLKRNFSPEYLIKKYHIKAVHTIGRYRFRIIAPFFLHSKTITFVARDVTGKSNQRYLTCKNHDCIIPVKKTLYNIDTVRKKKVIILEGITDVWRIGDGSVANSGLTFTPEQLCMLIDKGVEEAFIIFDEGAENQARKYGETLSTILNKVNIITLPEGDPADQPPETIREIRKLLKLY